MEILFLSNRPTAGTQAATVTEYLDSLHLYSHHQVHEISMLHFFPEKIDLDRFDVVITHYSLSLGPLLEHYLGRDLVARLKRFRGLKAAFLQDEYREIKTYWRNLNELGIDVLFSCVPEHEIQKVYPVTEVPRLKVVNVLTGYVSEALCKRDVKPVKDRPIDVGYRTRRMPFWLGKLGYEKWFIAEEFERRARSSGLRLDLSTREGERLYGDAWTEFVASCKCVLGVESGASIIDFDGKLERRVNDYVAQNPTATFKEVSDLFLEPFEGSLELHQISPRCFEAAALRTPMVLFEGRYSGILKPNRHFIPLKKDFSNFSEVIEKLRDDVALQEMADRTFEDIACDPRLTYRDFISRIDQVLEAEVTERDTVRTKNPYNVVEFKRMIRASTRYYWQRQASLFMQSFLLGVPFARKMLFGLWEVIPHPLKRFARPLARIVSR